MVVATKAKDYGISHRSWSYLQPKDMKPQGHKAIAAQHPESVTHVTGFLEP